MDLDLKRDVFLLLLRRHWQDLAYLVCYKRLDNNSEDNCGTLRLADAINFADDELDGEQDGPSETERALASAWNWVICTVEGNLDEGGPQRFRVRGMGSKGDSKIFARNINVQAARPPITRPLRDAISPAFDFEMPAAAELAVNAEELPSFVHAYAALGTQYNQFGRLVLGTMHQISRMSQDQLNMLSKQLSDARADQADLVEVVVTQNTLRLADEGKAEAQAQALEKEKKDTEVLEKMGTEAFSALKFVVGMGKLSPSAIQVLETIAADPGLLAAIEDPDLRALLDDPKQRSELVNLLRMAAAAAKKDREANEANKGAQPHT